MPFAVSNAAHVPLGVVLFAASFLLALASRRPGASVGFGLRTSPKWKGLMMTSRIRTFLGVQALIFFVAALIHFEVLLDGYNDRSAGVAESVIGLVLLLGLILTYLLPARTRTVGLAAQVFALLGTFVGLTLLITVGPRTVLDVIVHVVMLAVLIAGLVVTARAEAVPEGFTEPRSG